MKIQLITAAALLALFTASTASAHKSLTATNNARNSIAIGGAVSGGGGWGGAGGTVSGSRAVAGSIMVKGCGCGGKTTLNNTSVNALAIGKATAGSIVKY